MSHFDNLLNNDYPMESEPNLPPQKPRQSKEEFAAMKKAERDAVFKLSDQTAEAVGIDPYELQQYLDVQSTFMNYSVVNALLIMAQNPEATRLGDFDYWNKQGTRILKGEKGISILEPKSYQKADGSQGINYNIKNVFDIRQVNAEKLRDRPEPNYTERQILAALIDKAPVKITSVDTMPDYAPQEQGAFFDYTNGKIFVRKGMGFEDIFKSVSQELALVQMGQQADNIPANPQFAAYCATYMLCKRYGVDTRSFSFAAAPPVFEGLEPKEVRNELAPMLNVTKDIAQRMQNYLQGIDKENPAKSQAAAGKEKSSRSQEAR